MNGRLGSCSRMVANMATPVVPCPSCGSEETRPITRKELRARSGGRDPMVVVMPLICTACGHVWEPRLSRRTCYLVASLTGVVSVVCSAVFAASIGVLVWSLFIREGEANRANRGLAPAIMVAAASLSGAAGTAAVCRKYIRLARKR